MYDFKKLLIFFIVSLVIDVEFLWAKCSFADDPDDKKISITQSDANAMKASNPNCQLGRAATEAVIAVFASAVALLVIGFVLDMSVVGTAFGIAITLSAIAALAGIIFATPGYFACKWSFVRHPVMRNPNNKDEYFKCEDPLYNAVVDKNLYEQCADREYGDEKQYYKCLGKGDEILGKKYEPTCPKAEYVSEKEYYWPKNRISRSKYIEFCYRLPIGEGLLIEPLIENVIYFNKNYTDSTNGPFTGEFNDDGSIKTEIFSKNSNKLYPREAYTTPKEDSIKTAKSYIFGGVKCSTLEVGDTVTAYSIAFQAFEKNDGICVNAVSSAGGSISIIPQPEIGCHMRPAGKPVPMCAESAKHPIEENGVVTGYDDRFCRKENIYQSCYGEVGAEIKSVFPVTSMIVSCIKESIDALLESNEGLNSIRLKMQRSVRVVLVLALVLFALKAILGGLQSTAEVYMLIIKFAIVIYMATGEGVIDNYRKKIVNLTTGLSDIVTSVDANRNKPCNFSQNEYKNVSKSYPNKDFRYLAIWDRLDCKMAFYLGSQLNSSAATTSTLFLVLSGATLFAAVLVAQNVLVCLVALLTVIMIILIVMSIVYIYILSLLGLAILAMIAPLMLPMLLFQVTRQFFDGWIRSIVTFALYPVIMFAFLSLVFTVFDQLYFGDLDFKKVSIKMLDYERTGFTLSDPEACSQYNSDSQSPQGGIPSLVPIGCIVDSMSFVDMGFLLGLNLTVLDTSSRFDTKYVWTSLGLFLLMAFLFYHFLQIVSELAAELSGSPRLGLGMGAAGRMNKFLSAAGSFSTKTSSAAAGLANKAMKALSPDSEKSSERIEGSKRKS